ncbi:MAG TPA: metallophosphoesterase, partial [Polyangiaceae bacterium]|nr:metallophosphoesterase [Polyangiaceae bacterium]
TLSDGVQAGGTENHFFKTAPVVGSSLPFSVWIVGDSGRGDATQASVRDGLLAHLDGDVPDLFFHVGDMAYDSGTDSAFTNNHFAMYEEILASAPFWPAVGNHEASTGDSDSATQSGPYYEAFSLPTAGQAGGQPSGTEAYYSFDYANAHVVVLDSDDSSTDIDSTQLAWLALDLANIPTTQTWLVAMFHHPPYSKGSHDSDDASDSGGRMVRARENILPILEAAGVDLVLSGHSHIYERSYLIDGVYGYGSSPNYQTPAFATLQANGNILDAGDGDPLGDGAYLKPTGLRAHAGAVYVVSGHGGGSLGRIGNHPVMAASEFDVGSCLLSIAGDTLLLRNIDASGSVVDEFELFKEGCDEDADCEDSDLCTRPSCNLGACEYVPLECPSGEECDADTGVCRPEPDVVSFRQGADGYAGTVDTYLMESQSEAPKGALDAFEWDTDDPPGTSEKNTALLRFERLFTSDGGPIPAGAAIASATLTYTVFDAGEAGDLYEADVDWTASSTYADFGAVAGVQSSDLGEFVGIAPASVATHSVDVSASLQRWSSAPHRNRGWAIVPASSNGTEVRSSEAVSASTRPLLTVTYYPPTACTTSESCDDADACTSDACESGDCLHTPLDCDDADPCTTDGCDSGAGCWYTLIEGCTATATTSPGGGAAATTASAPLPGMGGATAAGASHTGSGGAATAANSTVAGVEGSGGSLASTGGSSSSDSEPEDGDEGAGGGTGGAAAQESNLSDGAGQPGTAPAAPGLEASSGASGVCGCRLNAGPNVHLTPACLLLLSFWRWRRRRPRLRAAAPAAAPSVPVPAAHFRCRQSR